MLHNSYIKPQLKSHKAKYKLYRGTPKAFQGLNSAAWRYFLLQKNIQARKDFAKSHKNWTVSDWKGVIFSDATKINCFFYQVVILGIC